ncbi:MAG: pyridoxal 5'-phosphate synthase glutaminase subunit PdxT [Syntrophales bacterium]
MIIGVLALQGAFREHAGMLKKCGIDAVEVRLPDQLDQVDGLIIPGGESTTISKLMLEYGFPGKIKELASSGKPVFGTCAGLIVLANKLQGKMQALLNLIDIDVKRNAYGRQIESREVDLPFEFLGDGPFRTVFIRAPQIESIGPGVKALAWYQKKVIAARQNNILVCAFHPELTGDPRVHRYFIEMVREAKAKGKTIPTSDS